MRKLTYSAFVAFWASVFTLVIANQLAPSNAIAESPNLPSITLEQIAAHATEKDCWMAIEGKVYDFTAYIPKHPTPPFVITEWCGKEASSGMRTKGYGRDHSPMAWEMKEAYLIGTLAP